MDLLATYTLRYDDLRACLLFSAKNDPRVHLQSVMVGRGLVCATNGRIALICDEPEANGFEIIIPSAVVKSFIAKVGTKRDLTVGLSKVNKEFWLLHRYDCYEIFKPIEEKFPDIKRVDMPKPESYESKQFPLFNFDFLMVFHKASAIYLKIPAPRIYPTSTNGNAYIEINDRVHGIICPMHSEE